MNEFRQAMGDVKPLSDKSYHSWRQCKGKVPYFSVKEAQQVIDRFPEKPLRWYVCEECQAIHLSSKKLLTNELT